MRWGFAAVLDDTVTIQRIVDAVAAAGRTGALIDDLAGASGWSSTAVRELARPYDRNGSMRRRYLGLHTDDSARLRVLSCTYCRISAHALADRVVMLPEVARSGFGVLCACGRAPVPQGDPDHALWRRIVFPPAYTSKLYTPNRSFQPARRASDRPGSRRHASRARSTSSLTSATDLSSATGWAGYRQPIGIEGEPA